MKTVTTINWPRRKCVFHFWLFRDYYVSRSAFMNPLGLVLRTSERCSDILSADNPTPRPPEGEPTPTDMTTHRMVCACAADTLQGPLRLQASIYSPAICGRRQRGNIRSVTADGTSAQYRCRGCFTTSHPAGAPSQQGRGYSNIMIVC